MSRKRHEEQVQKTVQSFLGESEQLPPMYSAVSQNGVRLYELARRGETVERKPRHIRISEPVLSDMTAAEFTLRVTCSAGTYIRSLAHDIGQKLGTGAVLTALRRTAANGFTEKDCVTLEELECLRDENRLGEILRPVDACLSAYPALTVTAAQGVRFQNGGELLAARVKGLEQAGLYRVYAPENRFLGLGELPENGESLLVKRVFVDG